MKRQVRDYFESLKISEHLTGFHIVIILLLGLICYSNTFSVPFYFDDYDELINDQSITDGQPFNLILHGGSRRFADLTFALNYQIHGFNVTGYHVVNLALHLMTAVALYFLVSGVMQALDLSSPKSESDSSPSSLTAQSFIPLATSLFFVSHPLQTQAVTYIIQRYTLLACFFYIFTMLAYIKARICMERPGFNRSVIVWGLAGALSALLGFYSKPSIYSLPLMILIFEICLFRGRHVKAIIISLAAILVIILGLKVIPVLLHGGTINEVILLLHYDSTVDPITPRGSYLLSQLRVTVTYLRLLFLPVGQRLEYDYPEYSSLFDPEVAASLMVHIILISLALYLFGRSRRLLSTGNNIRGNGLRLVATGIAWFYIALSVTAITPLPDDIVEHHMYLPSAGLFMAIASIMMISTQKLKNGSSCRKLVLTAFCLILTVTTLTRNHVWGDELRFWQNEVRLSPKKGRVHANLGFSYLRRGDADLALRTFVKALDLDPTLKLVWIELGNVLNDLNRFKGRFNTGEEYLTPERDINYRFYNLFYSNAFNTMGLSNEAIGRPDDAMKWYKKSLTLNPESDISWYNFGLLSHRMGMSEQVNSAMKKLGGLNSPLADSLQSRIRNGTGD